MKFIQATMLVAMLACNVSANDFYWPSLALNTGHKVQYGDFEGYSIANLDLYNKPRDMTITFDCAVDTKQNVLRLTVIDKTTGNYGNQTAVITQKFERHDQFTEELAPAILDTLRKQEIILGGRNSDWKFGSGKMYYNHAYYADPECRRRYPKKRLNAQTALVKKWIPDVNKRLESIFGESEKFDVRTDYFTLNEQLSRYDELWYALRYVSEKIHQSGLGTREAKTRLYAIAKNQFIEDMIRMNKDYDEKYDYIMVKNKRAISGQFITTWYNGRHKSLSEFKEEWELLSGTLLKRLSAENLELTKQGVDKTMTAMAKHELRHVLKKSKQ